MSSRLSYAILVASQIATSALLIVGACDDTPPGSTDATSTGAGGNDAGCPQGPQPMFTVTITAQDSPIPPDLTLEVTWSVGTNPIFDFAEPDTWKTLEQGTNVVCDVDPQDPPPKDLPQLVCQLWTSGPAQVVIKANGYQTLTETLVPDMSDRCEGPIPKEVALEILPEPPVDAGP